MWNYFQDKDCGIYNFGLEWNRISQLPAYDTADVDMGKLHLARDIGYRMACLKAEDELEHFLTNYFLGVEYNDCRDQYQLHNVTAAGKEKAKVILFPLFLFLNFKFIQVLVLSCAV